MAKETEPQRLQARIVELENALKAFMAARKPIDLTAEEIKAYLKVRDALEFDRRCGDAPCDACAVYSRCTPPTNPCWVCGGCGYYPCYRCQRCGCSSSESGSGGWGRFTDLGG